VPTPFTASLTIIVMSWVCDDLAHSASVEKMNWGNIAAIGLISYAVAVLLQRTPLSNVALLACLIPAHRDEYESDRCTKTE